MLLTSKDYVDTFAAVNAHCAIDKVINTLTDDLAEGLSKFGARIAGASMFEAQRLMTSYQASDNEFDKGEVMGKAI